MNAETAVSGGDRASTGIAGLDLVLGGGFQRNRTYLIEGNPGAGKTTLALQFCMAGARAGERVLYMSTSESEEEIRAVARGHGWSLDGVSIHCQATLDRRSYELGQTIFHPTEVDLPRTMKEMLAVIERVDPDRLVVDSLSEIRLLADNPLWYRREILMLKEELAGRSCTTLLCDRPQDPREAVQTIAHGILNLEFHTPVYGPDRRRLRVNKLRGQPYESGFHDFKIRTGGIDLYPRLVAADHRQLQNGGTMSSGIPRLDEMFGGGLDRGTATLFFGLSGTGKSTVASQYLHAAARRGEPSSMYVFDERIQTLLMRAEGLGIDLTTDIEEGVIRVDQIDPAELTPGEFSDRIFRDVHERGVRLVVIDSLAGYFQAMPNENLLSLHLHELLSLLNQSGVSTILIMTQHGLPGSQRSTPLDLSYVADSVMLFHAVDHEGELTRGLSVYKRRAGPHLQSIRRLDFGPNKIDVGPDLGEFRGIRSDADDGEATRTAGADTSERSPEK